MKDTFHDTCHSESRHKKVRRDRLQRSALGILLQGRSIIIVVDELDLVCFATIPLGLAQESGSAYIYASIIVASVYK